MLRFQSEAIKAPVQLMSSTYIYVHFLTLYLLRIPTLYHLSLLLLPGLVNPAGEPSNPAMLLPSSPSPSVPLHPSRINPSHLKVTRVCNSPLISKIRIPRPQSRATTSNHLNAFSFHTALVTRAAGEARETSNKMMLFLSTKVNCLTSPVISLVLAPLLSSLASLTSETSKG